MLFYSNEDLKYHHTEPNTQCSLRAESEFQAIASGTSAASKYWCPPFPKVRKHKKLPCVLGGVQKSWNPGKEIQEVSVEPTINTAMGSTEPSTAPNGILHTSIKELSDHTTKHWAELLAELSCLCHQSTECHFLQQVTLENRISHAKLDEVTADVCSCPAGGVTQLSITHSLAPDQPG